MPEQSKGLYNKYKVERIDGKPGRENCQYFVVDVCHDPYGPAAVRAYIDALPDDFAQLKADLEKILQGAKFDSKTETVK